MWDEIVLGRQTDQSIRTEARAQLVAKSEDEVKAAVAFVTEHEVRTTLGGVDGSDEPTETEMMELCEKLRVRAYSVEVERAWAAMPHNERVRLVDHLDGLGAPTTEDSAKGLLSASIARMAISTIIGGAEQVTGRKVPIEQAMTRMPITFQLLAIRRAGDYHAAPGQALKLLGVRAKRGWFGR